MPSAVFQHAIGARRLLLSNNLRSNPPPPGDRAPAGEVQIPNSHKNGARINGVLNALSDNELDQLTPRLRPFQLEIGDVLYEPDDEIDHVYFPTSGIISLLAAFADGTTVEAGVIGTEGMAGTPVALGVRSTPHQALVQIEGRALRMSAEDLRAEAKRDGALLKSMLRYTNAMFVQVAQTAACNRLHSVEQRLARWLLLSHDRVEGDEFELTQEFMARMLGVRRAGVSVAANQLREIGAIDYRRGNVSVLNRTVLEGICCECYQLVKDEYDRSLKS